MFKWIFFAFIDGTGELGDLPVTLETTCSQTGIPVILAYQELMAREEPNVQIRRPLRKVGGKGKNAHG